METYMNPNILENMKLELDNDPIQYLENCIKYHDEYFKGAKILFKDYYTYEALIRYNSTLKHGDSIQIDAAKIAFEVGYNANPDELLSKTTLPETNPYNYTMQAIEAKSIKNENEEIKYLEKAIENNVREPYAYDRLSTIYSKLKQFDKAYNICNQWFTSGLWKIPNMATTSLKILKRMEKLSNKTNNNLK